jgi:hypothetical protein
MTVSITLRGENVKFVNSSALKKKTSQYENGPG